MMTEPRRKGRAAALCVLFSGILLLFFSRCSPLYPTNSWVDANCFFTVGRGMLRGLLPYRDFVEQKGPLLYALHALAALISCDSFIGVWLIEIIAVSLFTYFSWKTVARISGREKLSALSVAVAVLLILASRAFVHGDTVEELIIPLQAWAMCDLLEYMRDPERKMPARRLALHGFLAGCVFWMKYSLLGVHFAFMAVIAVESAARTRKVGHALVMCLWFLLGMALSTVPWLIYFGVNGALGDLFTGYFRNNLSGYGTGRNPLACVVRGLGGGLARDPALAALLLCGAVCLLTRVIKRKWNAACTAVAVAVCCETVMNYCYGQLFRYSFMAMTVFAPLCCIAIIEAMEKVRLHRRAYAVGTCAFMLACTVYSCVKNDNLPYIGYPKSELAQTKFAEVIRREGGGSVLNYGFGDGGFYLAADEQPPIADFITLNLKKKESKHRQAEGLRTREIRWAVTRGDSEKDRKLMDELGYEWVMDASSPYDRNTKLRKTIYRYHLYRKKETA